MGGEYRVDTLAVPETLNLLHDLLDRVRDENPDVEATDLMLFETAVIESDQLLGHLRDGGPPLEESERAMPDTDSENGRGLALARVALDDLEYERVDDHNEWTMVRRRR